MREASSFATRTALLFLCNDVSMLYEEAERYGAW